MTLGEGNETDCDGESGIERVGSGAGETLSSLGAGGAGEFPLEEMLSWSSRRKGSGTSVSMGRVDWKSGAVDDSFSWNCGPEGGLGMRSSSSGVDEVTTGDGTSWDK